MLRNNVAKNRDKVSFTTNISLFCSVAYKVLKINNVTLTLPKVVAMKDPFLLMGEGTQEKSKSISTSSDTGCA